MLQVVKKHCFAACKAAPLQPRQESSTTRVKNDSSTHLNKRHANTQTNRQTDRQPGRQAGRQAGRQTANPKVELLCAVMLSMVYMMSLKRSSF